MFTKAINYSLLNDSMAIYMKTAPKQLTELELEKLSCCLLSTFIPIDKCSWYWKTLGRYTKRNINTKSAIKPLIYSGVLPARYASAMVVQSL